MERGLAAVQAKDAKGGFVRQASVVPQLGDARRPAGPTGEGGFAAEAGRYHLYVALICPWASRALIAPQAEEARGRRLRHRRRADDDAAGLALRRLSRRRPRSVNGATYLHEIYTRADPHFTGRATVPVLWDKRRRTIVNNESADIVRMFNSGFGAARRASLDLYPADLAGEIDALNDRMYARLNNGVYRAGFATTQVAYEDAFKEVFATLDALEARLRRTPLLFGDRLTESDIRAFVTLVRFDVAYHGVFKCNKRRIVDYPALQAYLHARARPAGSARNRVDRPHQARLLFDQDAQPQRGHAARAGHSGIDGPA